MTSQMIAWSDAGVEKSARFRSENGTPAPRRVQIVDDRITADAAFRLACEGTALLWQGDFQNARQLLQAMARRADDKPKKSKVVTPKVLTSGEAFHLHRQAQAQRARILNMLLIQFEADHGVALRRAPDVRAACLAAYGADPSPAPYVASLRGLQGLIGAFEWRKNGVEVPVLGARIHPHYGVFAPVRGEYISLVANAPFTSASVAFDIGTGTGVLGAVLAKRGIKRIVATDNDPRALACARENMARLNLTAQVEVLQADLFPQGRADLVVCNPPWVPARAASPLEHAIFDPESRMLLGFLKGLAAHLEEGGEGWLILSDFAEHLGLRTRASLLAAIDAAGLLVLGRTEVKPVHPRVNDVTDPLHAARKAEMTSLWRLGAA
jgi:Methyltransferase small domain